MKPRFSIVVVAAMVLACPAIQASKGMNPIAYLPGNMINEVFSYLSLHDLLSYEGTGKTARNNVLNYPLRRFVAKFTAAVSSSNDPSIQIRNDITDFKREMKPFTQNPTVPVRSLIQSVGWQKLVKSHKLTEKFDIGLIAMKSADGMSSLLHLTIKDYFLLQMLTNRPPEKIAFTIGEGLARQIGSNLANSGLGIDSTWPNELVLWLVSQQLPRRTAQSPPFLITRSDIAAIWCIVTEYERIRQKSLRLTPGIVSAVLFRMNSVLHNLMNAPGILKLDQATQSALDHQPFSSLPLASAFSSLPQCIEAQPSIGAIFAGLRQALDSALIWEFVYDIRQLEKICHSFWFFDQITLFGVDAKDIWWIASTDVRGIEDYSAVNTIRVLYEKIFSTLYGAGEPKDSAYFKATNGGILGWPVQQGIVYKLAELERYNRAANIFAYLGQNGLLPDDIAVQSKEIVGTLLRSSLMLNREQKLAQLRAMFGLSK